MSIRALSWLLGVIGVVSLVSLGAILLFLNATSANTLALILLTLSLGLFLLSALTLIGLRVRRGYVTKTNQLAVFAIALREAALAGILLLTYLWLAHFNALTVWVAPIALLAALALEYFFLTRARQG